MCNLYTVRKSADEVARYFGVVNPVGFRERILADPVFAVALGNDLGQILAEHHTRILRIERQG